MHLLCRFSWVASRYALALAAVFVTACETYVGPSIETNPMSSDSNTSTSSENTDEFSTSVSTSTTTTTTTTQSSDSVSTGECADFADVGDPMDKCLGEIFRARCEHAATFSEQIFEWGITLAQYEVLSGGNTHPLTMQELQARHTCLVDALTAAGASEIKKFPESPWFIRATASFAQVRDIFAADPITSVEARCRPDLSPEACPCGELDAKGCIDNPFCFPVSGRKAANSCLEPERIIGCTGSRGCWALQTLARAPDMRTVWVFPTTCLPEQKGWMACGEDGDETACEGGDWPECAPPRD